MKEAATYRYTGFYDLLADAIFQHRLAANCTDSYSMNRYARASVIASALSIEWAANCLLGSAKLPGALSEEIDKLRPLSKIDTALRLMSACKLDRGRNEVQKVSELIKARNDYVHPKAKKIEAGITSLEDAGEFWRLPMTLDGEHWTTIGIPKRAIFWSKASSLAALKAISDFFKYVFVDLLNANSNDLHGMLQSLIQIEDLQLPAIFEDYCAELKNALELGVDFSFFGMYQE